MLTTILITGGGKSKDCLNTIRLLAAFEVVYGHTIAHLNLNLPEWVSFIISFFDGVPIFFTLSGFLIWGSIGRSGNFKDYCIKRFWRIYPELWIAVAVEMIVLLALYSKPIKWMQMALFAFGQGTIFQFWTPDFLRDYGCGCPNGSLWTICVLIQFYFVAYYTYKKLHNTSITRWGIVFAMLVIISLTTECFYVDSLVFKLFRQTFIPYYWMFLFGASVAEFRQQFMLGIKKYWHVFVAATFLLMFIKFDIPTYHYGLLRTLFSFLACIGLGYLLPALNLKTDISYAVYIYHMTVVNAMIELGYTGKTSYLLITLVATAIVSYVSTKTIGEYSQMRKLKSVNKHLE